MTNLVVCLRGLGKSCAANEVTSTSEVSTLSSEWGKAPGGAEAFSQLSPLAAQRALPEASKEAGAPLGRGLGNVCPSAYSNVQPGLRTSSLREGLVGP